MKTLKILNRTVFALFAVFILAALASVAQAQNNQKYKVGDRVECHTTTSSWDKGTVVAFKDDEMFNGLKPGSGAYYRVIFDGLEYQGDYARTPCLVKDMRPLAKADANQAVNNQKANDNQTGNKPDNPNNDNQNQPNANGKFKVGDRVECDVTGHHKHYEKATIIPFRDNDGFGGKTPESGYFYRVEFDDPISRQMNPIGVPCAVEDMRPLAANDVAKTPNILPKRAPVKCPAQPDATGGAIPLALARQLIQCLWEDRNDDAYTVNFDLRSAQVGTPHLWNSYEDMGTGVHGKTLIYPVKGTWTKRRYESWGVIITEEEGVHNCYIDAFHKWECGLANSKYTKPLQSIYY